MSIPITSPDFSETTTRWIQFSYGVTTTSDQNKYIIGNIILLVWNI